MNQLVKKLEISSSNSFSESENDEEEKKDPLAGKCLLALPKKK